MSSWPNAEVDWFAVSPPLGPRFTTNTGRLGSERLAWVLLRLNESTVTDGFGSGLLSTFFTVTIIVERLASFCFFGKLPCTSTLNLPDGSWASC